MYSRVVEREVYMSNLEQPCSRKETGHSINVVDHALTKDTPGFSRTTAGVSLPPFNVFFEKVQVVSNLLIRL